LFSGKLISSSTFPFHIYSDPILSDISLLSLSHLLVLKTFENHPLIIFIL
jgi:hypothetical protein